jgi:2-amino-4-hydroxy-6-hydroxymethyldihydropteridine diphosphokinase
MARPDTQIRAACKALSCLPQGRLLSVSSLYRTAPVGPQDQPDYLNAVALLETAQAPHALLRQLQCIEQAQGRVRIQRWGARTLDLDLLLYDDLVLNTPDLQIPHPRMHERHFVLAPLLELAPGCCIPRLGPAVALLEHCLEQAVERLDS